MEPVSSSAEGRPTSRPPAPPHRIVVGVDGSENAIRALEWAAIQAQRVGAVLEVHSAYGPGYVLHTPNEVKEALQPILDEAASHVANVAPDVVTEFVKHEGSPASKLVDASEGADLLVVGSRGRSGFTKLMLGSVSQECAIHAPCPVVIVH